MSLVILSPLYQRLKGKHEGIVLALDIINRRDVSPASVRWLIKEKEDVERQIEERVREYEQWHEGEEE
ncbi:hypothetical protein [Phenylobacterium sp.]|uniref:hypothetical protein n=1 Tax=Phenylobacterium sp. TaxID=1871053 RepID=UPI000C8B2256|nr:hypothetical protein [Phenylobacterium sp.]MAK80356.1 hypothetical protein [Phenylobacterium sp.]